MPPLQIIGFLESCYQRKFGTPRQPQLAPSASARLRILPEFEPLHSLEGLEEFSHIWLLSWFHLNTNKMFHPKIHPPRLQGGKIGIFASRSPHRPNPIGLSLAKLERIEGDTIYLSGIDLISGTPVLDIKPYVAESDFAADSVAGWVGRAAFPELKIVFSEQALLEIESIDLSGKLNFKQLIADTLRHDPRNARDNTQMKDGRTLYFALWNHDVDFSVQGDTATVLRIRRSPYPAKY